MTSLLRCLAALAFCAFAAACNPAFTEHILDGQTPFHDRELLGRWYSEDANEDGRVVIRRRGYGYDIAVSEDDGGMKHYSAVSIRHAEHTYLIIRKEEQATVDGIPPETKLYDVMRYTLANRTLTLSLASEQKLRAMIDAGALPDPVGHYCSPSVAAAPETTEGVGPPAADAEAQLPPSLACTVFDVTMAQLAPGGGVDAFAPESADSLIRLRRRR